MPKSILKGKGPDLQSTSTVMDSLKTKTVTFKDFVVNGVQVTKGNVLDMVDRVKQADISGFMDSNTSTKVVEAKNAAVQSVENGTSNFPSPATTPTAIDSTPTSVSEPAISSISEPRAPKGDGFTPGMDSTPTKPSTNSILGLVTPENTPTKGVDLSELSPTKSEKGLT